MKKQHERTAMLLGEAGVEKLNHAHVAIFGVGGVGGYVAEALARAGVGALTLCDNDVVSESNINRQIIALHSTVGLKKVDAAAARILDIDPDVKVMTYDTFFLPETADRFDFTAFDYVVDAVDTVAAKLELYRRAKAAGVPVISAMGAGNKLDPTAFRVSDIHKTEGCPLARAVRVACRKEGIKQIKVVYSTEEPKGAVVADNGRYAPGSISFVPSAMGLIIAAKVVKDFCCEE